MTPFAFDPASIFLLALIVAGALLLAVLVYGMIGLVESVRGDRRRTDRRPTHTRVEGETPESREH